MLASTHQCKSRAVVTACMMFVCCWCWIEGLITGAGVCNRTDLCVKFEGGTVFPDGFEAPAAEAELEFDDPGLYTGRMDDGFDSESVTGVHLFAYSPAVSLGRSV